MLYIEITQAKVYSLYVLSNDHLELFVFLVPLLDLEAADLSLI